MAIEQWIRHGKGSGKVKMSKRDDQAWELRDHARAVAVAKGGWIEIDGAQVLAYVDARLRIEFTPPLAGTAMPFQLDIWKLGERVPVKVLACLWGASDSFVVLYRAGVWERALWAAAGVVRGTGSASVASMPVA
jgi:hypothetical protein